MPSPNRSLANRTNRRVIILDSVRVYKKQITRTLSSTGRVVWTLSDILILLDDAEEKSIVLLGNALLGNDGRKPRSKLNDDTVSKAGSEKE